MWKWNSLDRTVALIPDANWILKLLLFTQELKQVQKLCVTISQIIMSLLLVSWLSGFCFSVCSLLISFFTFFHFSEVSLVTFMNFWLLLTESYFYSHDKDLVSFLLDRTKSLVPLLKKSFRASSFTLYTSSAQKPQSFQTQNISTQINLTSNNPIKKTSTVNKHVCLLVM